MYFQHPFCAMSFFERKKRESSDEFPIFFFLKKLETNFNLERI